MQPNRNVDRSQWSRFLGQWGLFPLVLVALLIGLVLSFFFNVKGNTWSHLLAGAIFFVLAGAGLIVIAELPSFRSGQFSLRYRSIPTELKRHYLWGWGLFIIGIIVSGYLLLSYHQGSHTHL